MIEKRKSETAVSVRGKTSARTSALGAAKVLKVTTEELCILVWTAAVLKCLFETKTAPLLAANENKVSLRN